MSDFRSGLAALALAAFTVTAAPALAQPAGVDAAITARANGGDLAAIRQIGAAYVTAQRASRTRSEGERNEAEAIAWYRKAADKGDYPAMYALGVIYASRDPADGRPAPVVPAGQERFILEDDDVDRTHDPNMQEAVRWFRMAADKGYAPAMFGLGTSYADGSGVDVSGPEAVRWLTKAAELGDTDSMVNLGFYYTRGTIMPRNEAESLRWYRLAADKGNPVAMFTLGVKYHEGEGLPRSYADSVKWERMAADKGYAAAMFNLGHYYARGEGVAKSEAESLRWYRMAAANGSREAAELLRQRGLEVSTN